MKSAMMLFSAFWLCFSFNSQAQNSPAPIKLVQFVLTPNHADWNYKINEDATVNIMVHKYGVPIRNIDVRYQYGPEMLDSEKKGHLFLKDGTGKINIGSLKSPGFKQLIVKATVDGYTYRGQVKLGFNPYAIKPTVKMPKDFDAFWDNALEENSKIPLNPKITYKPEYSNNKVEVYLVRLQNYRKGKYLYGYLCKPRDNKKHPVLFHPPGAGVKKIKPFHAFAEAGFISFITEIHGISPEIPEKHYNDLKHALKDYWALNLDNKDEYYYKSVYLGCSRAIDFLTSLPEFDGKNVVVTGGSQGGALTIVTAGLNKRVSALASFYPALSDNSGYLNNRPGGWPHMFSKRYAHNTAGKIETAAYFDVVNFAKKITVPGFYSTGYNDNTCAPTSVFSVFNAVSAPKEIVITPISGHWRFGETNDVSMNWLKQKCGIE